MDRQAVVPPLSPYSQYHHFIPYQGHQHQLPHHVQNVPLGHAYHESTFYHDPGLASRSYAAATPPPTMQLHHHHHHQPIPPQQTRLPAHHHQQQQQHANALSRQQQQLTLAAGSFHNPNFRPQRQHHLPLRTRQQPRCSPQQHNMSYQAGGPTEDELAELQKLSSEYEPEVTGPLVGQRVPSTAITTEYANADPILQAKTANLPSKYAFYRTVRGDGRCGWRAIAFGYFEALAHQGDPDRFLEEEGRLRSLGNIVRATSAPGFDEELINDIADEALTVMRRLSDALRHGQDTDAVLLDLFNDEMVQNYVITYLKTLTAAWMKQRSEEYAPFLVGQTVPTYCDSQVMPLGAELDNVSLIALKDVLVNPASISLEVVYLDRSESSEVNTHRFDPTRSVAIGVIRLLYRPGHYDIVYKAEDVPTQHTIPTFLQYSSETYQEPAYEMGMPDFMTLMPGMSYTNPGACWMSTSGDGGLDFFGTPAPAQQSSQQSSQSPITVATPTPQPITQAQPEHVSSMHPPPSDRLSFKQESAAAHSDFMGPGKGIFRHSRYEYEQTINAPPQTPWQTNVFRDSPHNPCHFRNDDFQPELWDPESALGLYENIGKRHKGAG